MDGERHCTLDFARTVMLMEIFKDGLDLRAKFE